MRHGTPRRFVPVAVPEIVVSAVDVSLPLEAGGLVLQFTPALHAFQTRRVPLSLHCAQVELVRDAQPAAGAQRRLPTLLPALHLEQRSKSLILRY